MSNKIFLVDIDRCIRCYACEVACKQENRLPPGPRWCSVVTLEPRRVNGELHTDFVFTTCMQCENPFCVVVCPENALIQRSDKIVVPDESKCTGCGLCVKACPFGAIHVRSREKKVWKCALCADRTDAGLEPECVRHCAGGALQYLSPEEYPDAIHGRHLARFGQIVYVSTKWKLSSF